MPVKNAIKLRRGTAALWTSTNPILLSGEQGLETDTGLKKIGDGTSAWTALSYEAQAWDTIQGKPTTFTPSAHTHVTGDVTGLDTALSGKAALVHTHSIADITDYTPPVQPPHPFLFMGA